MNELFRALWANTVGFDPVFNYANRATATFPHYDILKEDDDHYVIQVALAGYGPNDVEINWLPGTVTINTIVNNTNEDKEDTHVYRGIAKRDFRLQFPLAQHVEIGATDFVNGLLRIELVRNIPDSAKPRKIAIGYKNENLLTDDRSNVVSQQTEKPKVKVKEKYL